MSAKSKTINNFRECHPPPLFGLYVVQPTEDEGEALERPFESQPIPSPPYPSKDQLESQPDPSIRPSPSIPIPDSNLEGSGGNHGGQSSSDRSLSGNKDGMTLQSVYDLCISLCKQVIIQAKKIKDLKAQIKKLKKKAKPMITHHKAWMIGAKSAKSKPTAHKDQAFDDLDDFGPIDYMETKDAHNEKGVRPRPTSTRSLLTLKPLPKIDPKDKGKKVLEEESESNPESEGVNEAERKFAQLVNDEEIARKVQEEWETEEKNKKVVRKKDFKDERRIKDVNKKATGIKKYDNIKEESKEEESTRKRKLGTRKKIKSRKRRFRQDTSQDDQTDSERENDELRLCLTIAIDEDKEVDYEILDKKYPIIEWKTEYLGTKPQFGEPKRLEEINLNVLESEEDSTMALELIRFVKKLIAELEPENSDGDEEDL
ncbi:hypothetical protein Tco_0003180 [Tanacetum coccineum]